MARIVPWVDEHEWTQVYTWFYSDCVGKRKLGLDRVRAWRSRGRVPVAVDATATLVEVNLCEEGFVNGMVDNAQKGMYARSVAALAAQLALTEWLVDLRHEATHTQLPGLGVLRLAAAEALSWLRMHYWEKQANHGRLVTQAVSDKLDSYMALVAATPKEEANSKARSKECAGALKDFIQSVGTDAAARDILMPLLLGDGYLVPRERKARPSALGPMSNTARDLLDTWEPVLSACHATWPSFTPALFTALLTAVVEAAWAFHLAGQRNVVPDRSALLDVVRTCTLSPSMYTQAILNAVSNDLDEDMRKSLAELASLHYTSTESGTQAAKADDDEIQAWLASGCVSGPKAGEVVVMCNGWRLDAGVVPSTPSNLDLPGWLDTARAGGQEWVVEESRGRKRSGDRDNAFPADSALEASLAGEGAGQGWQEGLRKSIRMHVAVL